MQNPCFPRQPVPAAGAEPEGWVLGSALPLTRGARAWLLAADSLTRRLRQAGGRFQVELLREAWLPEAHPLLGEGPLWERQVLLCLDGIPRVWGRTLIPAATLAMQPVLRGLGAVPLGDWLFRQPRLRRGPIEVADFSRCPALAACLEQWGLPTAASPLWGRRSLLQAPDWRLLVTEVFLPGAPVYEE